MRLDESPPGSTIRQDSRMRLTRSVSPQGAGQDGPRQSLPSERADSDRMHQAAACGVFSIRSRHEA